MNMATTMPTNLHASLSRIVRRQAVLERGDSVYRCEQRAGDVLVLPDLWGHLTYNLQTSVGFAQEFRF